MCGNKFPHLFAQTFRRERFLHSNKFSKFSCTFVLHSTGDAIWFQLKLNEASHLTWLHQASPHMHKKIDFDCINRAPPQNELHSLLNIYRAKYESGRQALYEISIVKNTLFAATAARSAFTLRHKNCSLARVRRSGSAERRADIRWSEWNEIKLMSWKLLMVNR